MASGKVVSMTSYSKRRRGEDDDEEDEMSRFMREAEEEDQKEAVSYESAKSKSDMLISAIQAKKAKSATVKESVNEEEEDDNPFAEDLAMMAESQAANKSLFTVAAELRKKKGLMDKKLVKQDKQSESEAALLKEANQVQTNALLSNAEVNFGLVFFPSIYIFLQLDLQRA